MARSRRRSVLLRRVAVLFRPPPRTHPTASFFGSNVGSNLCSGLSKMKQLDVSKELPSKELEWCIVDDSERSVDVFDNSMLS
jgi:hypothetical protein